MYKWLLAVLWVCLFGIPAFAQKNDVGVFGVVNFNTPNYIHLNAHGTVGDINQPVVSSNRSSVGGGAEYRHWFSPNFAWGVTYEQNPSEGKLWVSVPDPNGYAYRWPLMHYDTAAPVTERFHWKRTSPFLQAGPGFVLTNGYSNSGWSWNFAFVGGSGLDYPLSKHVAMRIGTQLLLAKPGCYNDHTCVADWSLTADTRVGIAFNW